MRWIPRVPEPSNPGLSPPLLESLAIELGKSLRLPTVVARLLVNRGIRDSESAWRFLNPRLDQLHSPYLMCGMRPAVDRLRAAIEKRERILIYGDYDVDGTMAVVILKTAIELCGGVCDFHVPHRILEGYGMRDEVIERAAAEGIRLIISVDTGIRAFAAAETAERLGLDLIVTDHHLPHEHGIPRALAVLNPNQPACEYPCKALCGAGVAFKVAQALFEVTGRERYISSFLKVVAIATIADAVPLIGENRVFVKLGLEGLSQPVNAGLRALLEVCELRQNRTLTTTEVAFRVAPRMNAAGRMDVAKDVIDLFTVKDPQQAREIALRLHQLNGDRQQEEARIVAEIQQSVEDNPALRESYCMVVDGEGWHRGVIGICASRVVDRYHRPALVLSRDGNEAHGSGRSIRCFHLLNALESCPDVFTRYGGHSHAVGFALASERIAELRERLDDYARKHLTEADFVPVLETDRELPLDEITPALWEDLNRLVPFGMGNPEPVFVARGAKVLTEPRIVKEKHLKLKLSRGGNGSSSLARAIDVMGWRMAERVQQQPIAFGDALEIAYRIERNTHPEFGGSLQLVLCDYEIAAQGHRSQAASHSS
ncbi:MAG: single-stranded-DNA-specific exonuclease RecJ [Acidobacteriaceae bacterium]